MVSIKVERMLEPELFTVCWNGFYHRVKALLNDGVDVAMIDEYERTPLHFACSQGHEEVVSLLLTFGAPLGARDMVRP
jgi:ankyrin repeat protein